MADATANALTGPPIAGRRFFVSAEAPTWCRAALTKLGGEVVDDNDAGNTVCIVSNSPDKSGRPYTAPAQLAVQVLRYLGFRPEAFSTTSTHGIDGMRGERVVILPVLMTPKEQQRVKAFCRASGARYEGDVPCLSVQTTHVVCGADAHKLTPQQLALRSSVLRELRSGTGAIPADAAARIAVVRHNWLVDCVKQWTLLPTDRYLLDVAAPNAASSAKNASGQAQAAKKAAAKADGKRQKLDGAGGGGGPAGGKKAPAPAAQGRQQRTWRPTTADSSDDELVSVPPAERPIAHAKGAAAATKAAARQAESSAGEASPAASAAATAAAVEAAAKAAAAEEAAKWRDEGHMWLGRRVRVFHHKQAGLPAVDGTISRWRPPEEADMRGGDTRTGGWRMVHDEVHVEEDLNLAQMVEALAAYERQMATAPADQLRDSGIPLSDEHADGEKWRCGEWLTYIAKKNETLTYIASRTGIDTRTVQEIRRDGGGYLRGPHIREMIELNFPRKDFGSKMTSKSRMKPGTVRHLHLPPSPILPSLCCFPLLCAAHVHRITARPADVRSCCCRGTC